MAQYPTAFTNFDPYGWGTFVRAKAAGDQWIHMAIPLITYLEGRPQKISRVEFCAKPSNGVSSRPIRIDIWANGGRFVAKAIAWPADNLYHCYYVPFDPPVWKEALGVSILLHFANTADTITMYKAWVRLVD